MTTSASDGIQPNEEMKVVNIPLSEIFSDEEFNIRGAIRMPDVVDLARNINTHGLQQPIAVQPYTKQTGYKFRIVLGHRRFAAHQYLQRATIPAIVKDNLTELSALALNFNENINRKDLNILEEAHGIKRFLDAGQSIDAIAKIINKGRNWVNIRRSLLDMPPEIQEDAAAGFLTQSQILELSGVSDPDEQMKIVRSIKEAKLRGESRLPKVAAKKTNPTKPKKRNPGEIMDMLDHIIEETGITSPYTRTMAWANGEISDLDLYRDMIKFFAEHDTPYEPPIEIRELLAVKNP